MKNILGIIGSPRKLGNCEIIIKEISKNIETPHKLSLLRLSDFNIKRCKGCYTCLFKNGECVIKDDLKIILDAIIEADALIISVPTYFLAANASLKLLLDRGLSFYGSFEKLWGKPAIGIGIAGIKDKEGYTKLCIQNFMKAILTDTKACKILYGALPGEIFLNEENKSIATDLAKSLFDKPQKLDTPHCPLCKGDTFQFIEDNKVKCMLCSSNGTILTKNGKIVFDIKTTEPDFFKDKEEALNHKEWLCSMKNRFLEKKNDLKSIGKQYVDDGTCWIKPDKN
jgi:multimeric flavodoxin WrbA